MSTLATDDVKGEGEGNSTGNPLKRRLAQDADSEDQPPRKVEHTSIVAAHYNHLEEKGLRERFNSPIFYLRNFNNWVKSVLIQEYVDKIREKDYGRPLKVLDICCGKGGDMGKWQKARVEHVVFADIAEVSVQQCKERYKDMRGNSFSAQFIAADCTKECLRNKYVDPSIRFDIVSCQFGLHYSFESLGQARRMLMNITECLKPGGYFFGTLPNANEIVSRAQKSENGEFGNRIYSIKLMFDAKDGYPLFGGKYDFHLEGVVDCPEFLVYFDLFQKLASEYDLELVYKAGLADVYKDHVEKYKHLLYKIKCFESYPPPPGKDLIASESEYEHAKVFWENHKNTNERYSLSTMSKSEWEVANVYMAFVFKKCKKQEKEPRNKTDENPSSDASSKQ
ncbi:unnamed protein product [Colias eurytheme]|nr:unnamed protein product [Colias eurytheme]